MYYQMYYMDANFIDKAKKDPTIIGLISLYDRRKYDEIVKYLVKGTEPWAPAAYSVRLFFDVIFLERGIKACETLCAWSSYNPLLQTVLYSMLGHRYFDVGDVEKMRAAYKTSLEAADKCPHLNVHTNAQKWIFSTYFYWARHDSDIEIKKSCLHKAMFVPPAYFHPELIRGKFVRAFQWLRRNNPSDTEAIAAGMASMEQFRRDGRLSFIEYNMALDVDIKFSPAIPGAHDIIAGDP